LTTKFTQHTAALAISSTLSSRAKHQFRDSEIDAQSRDLLFDSGLNHHTPFKLYGPLILLLARLLQLQRFPVLPSQGQP
jgi:hypothetical protein